MATHTIMLPDDVAGGELRSIIWDDVAGTVTGDHYDVSYIRGVLEAPKPVRVGEVWGEWELNDPGHDPTEFLICLPLVVERNIDPADLDLPAIFDGLTVPDPLPDTGEILDLGLD